MRGAVGAEHEGHVPDAFAVRHDLRIQRDVYACLIIVVLRLERQDLQTSGMDAHAGK
jgi:hypothetical protein